MSTNETNKQIVNQLERFSSWLEGVLAIGGGIILPIFAWSKRPMELRDVSDSAIAMLQNDWVLKPLYFYGSFVVAVALIAYGIGRLKPTV